MATGMRAHPPPGLPPLRRRRAPIAAAMLQDQGGGLQPISYWARKLNPNEFGNTYSAYDLEALAVCEAVKHWRCYLEGCPKFLVVTDHDTLRHLRHLRHL
jgi:hypothetical protein